MEQLERFQDSWHFSVLSFIFVCNSVNSPQINEITNEITQLNNASTANCLPLFFAPVLTSK